MKLRWFSPEPYETRANGPACRAIRRFFHRAALLELVSRRNDVARVKRPLRWRTGQDNFSPPGARHLCRFIWQLFGRLTEDPNTIVQNPLKRHQCRAPVTAVATERHDPGALTDVSKDRSLFLRVENVFDLGGPAGRREPVFGID